MNSISLFFDKFKNLITSNTLDRQIIADVIEKVVGVKINPSEITIKHGVVHMTSSPVLRNEIAIKKRRILEEFATSNLSKIKDIR